MASKTIYTCDRCNGYVNKNSELSSIELAIIYLGDLWEVNKEACQDCSNNLRKKIEEWEEGR